MVWMICIDISLYIYIEVECLLFLKVHAITMTMTYEPPVFFPAHSNSRRKSCHTQIISQRFTICDVFAMAHLYHGEAGRKIRTNVLCFCNVGQGGPYIIYTHTYRWLGRGNMMVVLQARFFDATFASKLCSGVCSYLTIFVQVQGRQNHASRNQLHVAGTAC